MHNSLKYNHSRVFFLICIYQDLSSNEKLGYEITRTELEDRGYCSISFLVKRVLDKTSLVEVIVLRLPFLMGLFLEKVKLGSIFYIKWALALIFMALRLHSSKSLSVFFAITYHSVSAGFRL